MDPNLEPSGVDPALVEEFMSQKGFTNLDYVISAGRYEWRLHRYLLVNSSEFFANLVAAEVLQNGRENHIDMNEHPQTVSKVLQWLYIGRFEWNGRGGMRINRVPTLKEILDVGRVPGIGGPHDQQLFPDRAGVLRAPPTASHDYAASLVSVYVFGVKFGMPILRAEVIQTIADWVYKYVRLGQDSDKIFRMIWGTFPLELLQNNQELRTGLASMAAEAFIDANGMLNQDLRQYMASDPDFCLKVADSLAWKIRFGSWIGASIEE